MEMAYLREHSGRDPNLEAPFADDEYRARLRRTREAMAELGIEALILTAPEGMCYLHNYQASWYRANSPTIWPALAATAVHVEHDHLIHFDQLDELLCLYKTSLTVDRRFYPDESLEGGLRFLTQELKAQGWLGGTVGLEFRSCVPNPVISQMMKESFEGEGCTVVDGSMVMRTIRLVKSPREIAHMEEAARIADIGHAAIRESVRPGVTELEVFGNALAAMLAAGGEMPAINQGVQSGPMAIARGLSSRRVILEGEDLFADLCGVLHRYHANVCRHYLLGEPSQSQRRLFEAAGGAFDVLCQEACDGAPVAEVNRSLRDYYKQAGIWHRRMWVGGYELGISFPPDWVGEFVFAAEDEAPEGVFRSGMVTNFESVFRTGLIDTIVYEKEGARRLSKTRPTLTVIG